MRSEEPRFLLVREDLLPEAIVKTLQAKQLLEQRDEITVHEAVEAVGLSRSAFYKYKDGVFELNRLERERIVTISMHLQHKSGILSRVLSLIASFQGNVLTIQQTIPLQGWLMSQSQSTHQAWKKGYQHLWMHSSIRRV